MFIVVCMKSVGDEEERKKVSKKRRARLLMLAAWARSVRKVR